MTTGVDILFKELPPVSQAGDRISKPDASPVGSSNTQESTSRTSNKSNGKYEKSFSDHLDDHKIKKEKSSVSKTDSHSENHRAHKKNKKETHSSNEVDQSTEKTSIVSKKSEVRPNDVQKQIFDEEKIEPATAPEVDAIKADRKSINKVNENILIAENNAGEAVQITNNKADDSIDHEVLANDSNEAINENVLENVETGLENKNGANGTIPVSTATVDSDRTERNESKSDEKQSKIAEHNQNNHLGGANFKVGGNNAKAQIDKTDNPGNIQNSELKSSQNEFSDFVHKTQNEQKEIRQQNTEARKNSDDHNDVEIDNYLPQETGTIISDAAKSNQINAPEADANTEKPAADNNIGISNAGTLPEATIQNAKNDQSLSPPHKKDEELLSSVKGKKSAQNSANSTASITNENKNIATSSTQQSVTKSDIQLDLGTTGQKFETLLPQTNPLNGQPHIANGGLLIAQEAHTQNAAPHQIGILKADNPAMTKMINDQITVAINRNIGSGHHNFSIRLHPAELGQVDVKVEFLADGKMHTSMMVESEKTLSMLQRDQHSLGRALQDAGINLSQKEMSFSLMKQSQDHNSQQFTSSGRQFSEPMKSEEIIQPDLSQYVSMGYSNQAIDISV